MRDPERVKLEREIAGMEQQLQEMLKVYTFKHPEVIALQTEILLKKRQLRQFQDRVEDSVKSSKEQNPEYGVLKGKLDDAVVKLQIARSSLKPLQNQQQATIDRANALAEFVGPYRKLKDRLSSDVALQQEAEKTLKDKTAEMRSALASLEPRTEILKPAEVPTRPSGPARSLYVVCSVILAFAAGLIGMSASCRFSPHFASEFELERLTGSTVAAGISAAAGTEAEARLRRRRRLRATTMIVILALAAAAVFVMAHYSGQLPGG